MFELHNNCCQWDSRLAKLEGVVVVCEVWWLSGAAVVISYPVSEDASASVGGLDVSDVGEVNLFGKNQQQQTLHPH